MATQTIFVCMIASETSAKEILELIEGCQILFINGTANTKYRDYSAEDIIDELRASGVKEVGRAMHLEDDSPSVININMIVPESEKSRLELWSKDADNETVICGFELGADIGDDVNVPSPSESFMDSWNNEFTGTLVGFRGTYAQVRDAEDNVYDIEPQRLGIKHTRKDM